MVTSLESISRRRTSSDLMKNCSVESLHVFEIDDDKRRECYRLTHEILLYMCALHVWFMTSIDVCSTGTLLSSMFCQGPSLQWNLSEWYMLLCYRTPLNLTEWIPRVSDLEVAPRLTYPLTVEASNCFTVYSHLVKGVKADSKHPVMKLISWETVSLTSSMTC